MSVAAASSLSQAQQAPQTNLAVSTPPVPPFLKEREADWRVQRDCPLFTVPGEILGLVGNRLFNHPISVPPVPSQLVLRRAIGSLAMTCKAGISMSLYFSRGLGQWHRDRLSDDSLSALKGFFARGKPDPGFELLKKAVQFIQAQTNAKSLSITSICGTPEGRTALLAQEVVQYYPTVQYAVSPGSDVTPLCQTLLQQSSLALHERSSFELKLYGALPTADLLSLVRAAKQHAKVKFEPGRILTANTMVLLNENLLAHCELEVEENDAQLEAFVQALACNTSLRSLKVLCKEAADLDRVLEGLAKSSVQTLTVAHHMLEAPRAALITFIRTHAPLQELVINRYGFAPSALPADYQQAIFDLDAAVRDRKETQPGFSAEIPERLQRRTPAAAMPAAKREPQNATT